MRVLLALMLVMLVAGTAPAKEIEGVKAEQGNLGSGLQSCKVELALVNGSPTKDIFPRCLLSCDPAG
jgi:hypothetical protein